VAVLGMPPESTFRPKVELMAQGTARETGYGALVTFFNFSRYQFFALEKKKEKRDFFCHNLVSPPLYDATTTYFLHKFKTIPASSA